MNHAILQPPDTCVHYGQTCRTNHSTCQKHCTLDWLEIIGAAIA